MLLFGGGAIQLAGEGAASGGGCSDWTVECRARHLGVLGGMSVEPEGLAFNLLDTLGHQEFSGDT
jgi:peptide chain release factor 3